MHRILTLTVVVICASVNAGAADEQKPERKLEAGLPALSSERSNPAAERKPAPGQPANPLPFAGAGAWGSGKSIAEWYIEQTDKIVNLSDEQKQKIRAEYESRDKATTEFQASIESKIKSVTASVTEAFKSQDKEAIAKSQKEYQELYAPILEIAKKSDAVIQAVLTAEQRTKLLDNQLATMLTAYTPGVEVSDAQRQEIKASLGQSAGDYEALGRKLPELIDRTLTADQIATILKHRVKSYVSMMYSTAKLSPEQLKKIDEKVAELVRDHKKTVNLNLTIYQRISEQVNGLLSAEQKEAMKAQRVWVSGAGSAATGSNPDPNKPAERKPVEPKASEAAPSNFKVTQIPGGGIQVIIREGGEAKEENAPQQRLQVLQRQLVEVARQAPLNNRASLRERVKRQHELTKKASKLMKKIDELGEGNREKAQELWEDLERVEGQLRQTFTPAHSSSMPAQPAAVWVQRPSTQAPVLR